jgi:hypothetical protein
MIDRTACLDSTGVLPPGADAGSRVVSRYQSYGSSLTRHRRAPPPPLRAAFNTIPESDRVHQDLFALVVAAVIFASGLAGLAYHAWHPRTEEESETLDLINRLTGLVATLSALVLGLLIASANGFHNSQKAGLETVSARILELDGVCAAMVPTPNRPVTC